MDMSLMLMDHATMNHATMDHAAMGHDMGLMAMSLMGLMAMSLMALMASKTMLTIALAALETATAMAGMDHLMHGMMDGGGMSANSDMGGMDHDMMGMHMWFTTEFKDYPVLFKKLTALTKAEAFGIFVLLFVVAFIGRALEFLRTYLETRVWHNPVYVRTAAPAITAHHPFSDKDEEIVAAERTEVGLALLGAPLVVLLLFRDAVRLALLVLPELLSYALMLAVMTYTLTYFFAVVVGLGVGRFVFDKLSYRMGMKPVNAVRC